MSVIRFAIAVNPSPIAPSLPLLPNHFQTTPNRFFSFRALPVSQRSGGTLWHYQSARTRPPRAPAKHSLTIMGGRFPVFRAGQRLLAVFMYHVVLRPSRRANKWTHACAFFGSAATLLFHRLLARAPAHRHPTSSSKFLEELERNISNSACKPAPISSSHHAGHQPVLMRTMNIVAAMTMQKHPSRLLGGQSKLIVASAGTSLPHSATPPKHLPSNFRPPIPLSHRLANQKFCFVSFPRPTILNAKRIAVRPARRAANVATNTAGALDNPVPLPGRRPKLPRSGRHS